MHQSKTIRHSEPYGKDKYIINLYRKDSIQISINPSVMYAQQLGDDIVASELLVHGNRFLTQTHRVGTHKPNPQGRQLKAYEFAMGIAIYFLGTI
jgi:hypothetical protein